MKTCWNCRWSINFNDRIRLCKWAELNEIFLPPYLKELIRIEDASPRVIYSFDYGEKCNVYESEMQ